MSNVEPDESRTVSIPRTFSQSESQQMKEDALRYICPHFAGNAQLAMGPKIFVRGEGCYVYDIEGKRYLDTFASLLTTICGHGRPEVARAVREQMEQLEFFPNYVDTFTIPLIELAKRLARITPGRLSVSFFVNSGSEANETAIKMARQYHRECGRPERRKIIARRHSYHGTTLGGISATGIPWFREYFEPLLPGFLHAPSTRCSHCELGLRPDTCKLACLRAMEELILWEKPETVAAVIIDPIPGSNIGYPIPPDGYLTGLRDLCDRHGILLIFDEVQTGFGKTGKMFACEHWGVTPDILTIGKGFSGGYIPLAAAVTTRDIYEVFTRPGCEFRSGGTYGGHTVACAATLANLDILERDRLVERAARMGTYLQGRLADLTRRQPMIQEVRGIGMLWAIELAAPAERKVGDKIRDYCWRHGMILRNNGDILVIAPALVMTEPQADEMLDLIEKALVASK